MKEAEHTISGGKKATVLNVVPQNVWKVVLVLDKPGMGISDVTEDTLAFALYLPNDNNYDDSQTPDWKTPIVFQGNQYGLLPVRDLEKKIKYNFFGNLPIEIQDAIETQTVGDILSKVGIVSAPLMAETIQESLPPNIPVPIFNTSPVGHSHAINEVGGITTAETTIKEIIAIDLLRSSKIGVDKNSTLWPNIPHSSFSKHCIKSINVGQIDIIQSCLMENSTIQTSSHQIYFTKDRITQPSLSQHNSSHISPCQLSSIQANLGKIGSTQIDILQNNTAKIDSFSKLEQPNSSEVSFSSSIHIEEFFTSGFHNSTPQIINNLNNTATQIWSNLLQTPTQLNLNFQITNLPSGQLASATITHYNPNGTPNNATITIDDDANGVGWYIDTTPQHSNEFTTKLTDTAYKATIGEAATKYDLLTTILHEMGHTLGFINGYSEFNKYIKDNKFITPTSDLASVLITRPRINSGLIA